MKPITRNKSGFFVFAILTAGLLAGGVSSRGASTTFGINADGIKEVSSMGVPNGDPDGSAIGTLLLDSGTGGTTGFAVFNLTLANLATPFSLHHIHTGVAGVNGSPIIDFGAPESIRSGNTLAGTISGLSSASINTVLANPSGFYYNLHNTPFPSGAVRDQLVPVPEPSTICLGVIAAAMAAGAMWRRSHKRS
jgi:hypothetical protein